MTTLMLPASPAAFARASWDDVAPYFDDLAARPLDEGTVESWLQAWSTLEELVTEAAAQAMIAYTIDTSDAAREADHLRFSTEVMPKMEERSVEMARRLVSLGLLHASARHDPPALSDRDRDLPRGKRSRVLRAGGVERPVSAHYRLDDRRVGRRGARPSTAPTVPQEPRPRRARARLSCVHPAVHGGTCVLSRISSIECSRCGKRPPGTRGSLITATTSFRPSSASTTRPPIASDSTRRLSARATPAVARMFEHRRRELGVDVLRPWDLAVDARPRRADSPLPGFGGVHRAPPPGIRERRRRARRTFPDDDRGAPARPREPQGQGARRVLRALHYRGRPFIFMNAVGSSTTS